MQMKIINIHITLMNLIYLFIIVCQFLFIYWVGGVERHEKSKDALFIVVF